jgi:hypothetical protein
VCSASKMHSPFGMQECQASLFDEDTPGIREFHNPSRIASEEVELMLFFEVGNLFAEGRLSDVQSVRRPRKVTLFGQDNDCVQVTDFEVGEHGSRPQAVKTSRWSHEVVRILIDFRTGLLFLWLVARIQDRVGRGWREGFLSQQVSVDLMCPGTINSSVALLCGPAKSFASLWLHHDRGPSRMRPEVGQLSATRTPRYPRGRNSVIAERPCFPSLLQPGCNRRQEKWVRGETLERAVLCPIEEMRNSLQNERRGSQQKQRQNGS